MLTLDYLAKCHGQSSADTIGATTNDAHCTEWTRCCRGRCCAEHVRTCHSVGCRARGTPSFVPRDSLGPRVTKVRLRALPLRHSDSAGRDWAQEPVWTIFPPEHRQAILMQPLPGQRGPLGRAVAAPWLLSSLWHPPYGSPHLLILLV